MQNLILVNARYWLRILQSIPQNEMLSDADLRGAAKAMETALKIPDFWEITKALAHALQPYMELRGYWSDWNHYLEIMVRQARQLGDTQAEAEISLWQGGIQCHQGDFESATLSCHRAWQIYHLQSNRLALAKVFSQLGHIYRFRRQFWRAEILCLSAVRVCSATELIHELALAENRLGLVYFDQLNYSEAFHHFSRAEALWHQTGDLHGLAKVLQNLGELYRRNKNENQALVCFEQAVEYYLKVGDEIYAAQTRLNIGNVYLNQRDFLQAEAIYLQVEATLRRAGASLDLALARHNLGIVYTHLKLWREAEACFARALEQWRARGDIWMEANTLSEIGMLHLAKGNQSMTKNYLDEAWKLLHGRNGEHFAILRREIEGRRENLMT